jgi:hypothetical protein
LVSAAQADGTIQQAQVERVIRSHAASLAANATEIQQAQVRIEDQQARVQAHNANVQRFNAMVAAAQADGTIQQSKVERAIRSHASSLAANATEIQQSQVKIEEFKATLAAYQIDRADQVATVAEKVRWHMSQIDRDAKYQTLLQDRTKTEVALFTAQLGQVESVARATAAVLGARTQKSALALESDVKKNAAELDKARITVAAQEAAARIDVAQAQWAAGQSVSLQAKIADNSFGYAQALAAAAHVGLSWGLSSSESYTP